jgi:hypothetical protein
MTDPKERSIVRGGSGALSRPSGSANPLISRMADDVLSNFKDRKITQERIQLGDYSFCQQDHRQIMRWSKIGGIEPLELLSILEDTVCEPARSDWIDCIEFKVDSGSIISLAWPSETLNSLPNEWEAGLRIESLGICGKTNEYLEI